MPDVWVALLAFTSAWASDALQACCSATNATLCPDTLAAIGPGASQVVGPDGATVTGVWTLRCDAGPLFQADGRITVARPFPPGTVVSPIVPDAVACWDASCRLPEGMCLEYDGKRVKAVVCADGSDAPDALWRATPRAPRGAVVIGGRVVGTETPPVSATVRTNAPAPVVAPTAGPGRPTAAPGRPMPGVDPNVPPAPPDPCIPASALRQPSNDQVDKGNESIVGGDFAEAVNRYRAAITINKCNAFAWTALGDALLQSGYQPQARTALEHATRLMPSNFHAWTSLGRSREQTGDRSAAAAAYRQALDARPDHAPAAEGLARVQ